MISFALRRATLAQGKPTKVGLYTSPHLVRFNERIQINGREIRDEELAGLIEEVRAAAEKNDIHPTFFEFTTALAFLYFARQKVDIAVVEVGLGGDLDATNVIHPEVAVITNIGYDHTEVLGNHREEIASHKAGIIKKGSTVVTGEEDPKLVTYFARVAKERGAKFVRAQESVTIRRTGASLDGQEFEAKGSIEGRFQIPLLGRHQLQNAAIALTVLAELHKRGLFDPLYTPGVCKGLERTKWPGRLQVISREPLIIVDGAHNEEGAIALENFLEGDIPSLDTSIYGGKMKPKVLVLAMKGDKHMPTMLTKIVPRFEKVIVTEGSYEPMAAKELARAVKKHHANVQAIPEPAKAVAAGRANLQKNNFMLVTGSLYMIGEALTALARSSIKK